MGKAGRLSFPLPGSHLAKSPGISLERPHRETNQVAQDFDYGGASQLLHFARVTGSTSVCSRLAAHRTHDTSLPNNQL